MVQHIRARRYAVLLFNAFNMVFSIIEPEALGLGVALTALVRCGCAFLALGFAVLTDFVDGCHA